MTLQRLWRGSLYRSVERNLLFWSRVSRQDAEALRGVKLLRTASLWQLVYCPRDLQDELGLARCLRLLERGVKVRSRCANRDRKSIGCVLQ